MSGTDGNYSPFSGYRKDFSADLSNVRSYADRSFDRNRGSNNALGSRLQTVDWSNTDLVPKKDSNEWKIVDTKYLAGKGEGSKTEKNRPQVVEVSDEVVQKWQEENKITVYGDGEAKPFLTFDALAAFVPQFLVQKLTNQGFVAPTCIQAQSWPILLEGRDLVGIAKTGSGKTLAFMIPAIVHIQNQPPSRVGDGPICVVLAPTRELAQQIETETLRVLPSTLRCGCLYGGTPKGPQMQMIRHGLHIVIATPGRLIDFLEIKRLNLFRTTFLVLDEADRMLDMGFEPQVRSICSQIRPDRQTLMFSATWPREIQHLAASFQRNWLRIHVGSENLIANADVTQNFILSTENTKLEDLRKILQSYPKRRLLVFCKTKKTADFLEHRIRAWRVDAMAIHGDKDQRQREYILDRFRRDANLCLVATDVAARGLDIKELEVVINYDFPMQIDDYVHRIGRTGRAGAKGASFTLITKSEDQINGKVLDQLIEIIKGTNQEVPEWLSLWADEMRKRFSVAKRGRDYGGYSSKRSRGMSSSPISYSHKNRPSFNPSTGRSYASFPSKNEFNSKSQDFSHTSSYQRFED